MVLHFSFLWFGQIFGQFESLKTSPEFSAVMLTLGGVHTFHPCVVFMFLLDLFWHEVILLDSDVLIAKIYCIYCIYNDMSVLHTKNPNPKTTKHRKLWICASFWVTSISRCTYFISWFSGKGHVFVHWIQTTPCSCQAYLAYSCSLKLLLSPI